MVLSKMWLLRGIFGLNRSLKQLYLACKIPQLRNNFNRISNPYSQANYPCEIDNLIDLIIMWN